MASVNGFQWLVAHSSEAEKNAGKWVAVGSLGIVAIANTLKELLKKPKVSKELLITKLQTRDEITGLY